MNVNPMALLGLKSDFDKFRNNHPKFLQFAKAFTKAGIQEGDTVRMYGLVFEYYK